MAAIEPWQALRFLRGFNHIFVAFVPFPFGFHWLLLQAAQSATEALSAEKEALQASLVAQREAHRQLLAAVSPDAAPIDESEAEEVVNVVKSTLDDLQVRGFGCGVEWRWMSHMGTALATLPFC